MGKHPISLRSREAPPRWCGLSPNLIRTWEKEYHAGHLDDTARQDAKAMEARIRELERMVGKLRIETG
jgi:hypothetical protein